MVAKVATSLAVSAMVILLAACERASEPAAVDNYVETVVVYVAFADDTNVREQLQRYSDETGVPVTVRHGSAVDIVDDIIENKVSPPADVLITQSVTDVWRAAEVGALRPVASDRVAAQLPAWSRDPDGLWVGTRPVAAALVSGSATNIDEITTFAALAEPRFAGDLCLSSSKERINLAVLAMLIDELGVRPAELIVRDWLKNLAVPPFASEGEVVAAIQSGRCKIGVVSSGIASRSGLAANLPAPAAADVSGIGIGRHAHNPDGALALVEWLFAELPDSSFDLPAGAVPKNLSRVARHRQEAQRLAERANYR